ncbi:PRC and DUF2382 domain-containing protein [Actinoplanes sp. NPDC023801]|uniref:PRC and DUF2382 domain-containing protein n=1 Tax=Actinoplanes sp. NPDC023801 TaxID=3154595 RepID=UPI0033E22668
MITIEQIHALTGRDVYDRDGDRIGSVGQVWHDGSGRPNWAGVKTGLLGMNETLVPLDAADFDGDRLVVPFDKATVKNAPDVDASHDEPLTHDDVERLYEYYGMNWENSGYRSHGGDRDAMTRSEERLAAGTEREEVGRARLRKYVVTEHEQTTVPVQREEVRLEREPITDANRDDAWSGPELTESAHEVTLRAERPVVGTETVPVERVRLDKDTVTEEQTVGGEVRKERIEADLPHERGRRTLD